MSHPVRVAAGHAARLASIVSMVIFFMPLAFKFYYGAHIQVGWVTTQLLISLALLLLAFPVIWLYRLGKGLDRPDGKVNWYLVWASVLFVPAVSLIFISAPIFYSQQKAEAKAGPNMFDDTQQTLTFDPETAVPLSNGEYEECILERMPGVANDAAAYSIRLDCFKKNPREPNSRPEKRSGLFAYGSSAECVERKGRDTLSPMGGKFIVMACRALY